MWVALQPEHCDCIFPYQPTEPYFWRALQHEHGTRLFACQPAEPHFWRRLQPEHGQRAVCHAAARIFAPSTEDASATRAPNAAARAAYTAADAAAGLVDSDSAARVKALELVAVSRFDTEGLEEADVEAGSRPVWKRFVEALPLEEQVLLRVFRGGAIRTPTRRHRTADLRAYPFYAYSDASARNF